MTNPEIAIMMMGVFILFVLLGFPIAFTLLAMGVGFGYYAYFSEYMSSIFDNRVLYSEPVKYIAKLRDVKEDDNEQLLKCKMEAAGHGGMSGRDNAIKELAEEYSFILKNAKI